MVVAPHVGKHLLPGEYLAGVAYQEFQQSESTRSQIHVVTVHARPAGAQFVPGVVEEPTLLDEGTLQPVQHAVELLGEGCDVVTAAGDVDAPGQALLGDVRRGLSDQTHGTQDSWPQEPRPGTLPRSSVGELASEGPSAVIVVLLVEDRGGGNSEDQKTSPRGSESLHTSV